MTQFVNKKFRSNVISNWPGQATSEDRDFKLSPTVMQGAQRVVTALGVGTMP